jgi:hypothetical protein
MHQPSLFDDEDETPGRVIQAVAPAASVGATTPEQRKFRKLVTSIEAVRKELVAWRSFQERFEKQYAEHAAPLFRQYRLKRIELVRLLDRHMSDPGLGKSHRRKVTDILVNILVDLLAQQHDDELVLLHDRYSDLGFADVQALGDDLARSMAEEIFGVDMTGVPLDSPEALAAAMEAKFSAPGSGGKPSKRSRRKSPKTLAKEARLEEAEKQATRSVREVFRQLASALHPDREQDPAERARKTALMQEVNRAYGAGDLLALLELQLQIEQIDPAALASLARERLVHYNRVLQEQLSRLLEELHDLKLPTAMALGEPDPGTLTAGGVTQAFEIDFREMRENLRSLEADLDRFQDVQQLKVALRTYRIERDGMQPDVLADMFASIPEPRGRRRR